VKTTYRIVPYVVPIRVSKYWDGNPA